MSTFLNGQTPDYLNTVRSVDNDFDILRAQQNTMLLSLIARGMDVTNIKHEWGEDVLTPTRSDITNVAANVFTVSDGSGFEVGMVLGVEKATGASVTEQVQIASIANGNELTVTRTYGGTTGATIVATDELFVISNPKNEGTSASTGYAYESPMNYNYTEIFDFNAKVSKTAQEVEMYGPNRALEMAIENEMNKLMHRMNNSIIQGRRVQRVKGGAAGSMGGILQFMEGGNVETTGGNISSTIINNMFEAILSDGGFSSNYALVCGYGQARKISAFNTAGTNPQVQVGNRDVRAGQMISQFMGDIPVANGQLGSSFNAFIVPEPSFPKDKVALVDLDRVTLRNLRNRQLTTTPSNQLGDDFWSVRGLGEFTLEVKSGKAAMAIAEGLNL